MKCKNDTAKANSHSLADMNHKWWFIIMIVQHGFPIQLHPSLIPFDCHVIQGWRQISGLPSPQKFAFTLSRPDLGWSCSSRFHIYIIKWKTRRLQYWLINKYTGINSYYYHSLPFWLKAKGLWPGCLTTETYPLSLNIESSEADLVSDEGKHKRWRQFADDGETP